MDALMTPVVEKHIAPMRRTLDRAREFMEEGSYREALSHLETLFVEFGYWEWLGHPGIQELQDEARRVAGTLRARMGKSMGARLGAQEEPKNDYKALAQQDAVRAVGHFMAEIVGQILKRGYADDDLESYGRGYHHARHVDRAYSLREAVEVLEQLDEHQPEESDVWQGLMPAEAISVMAAYTYGNAVHYWFHDLIDAVHNALEDVLPKEGPKEWSPRKKGFGKEDIESLIREILDQAGAG